MANRPALTAQPPLGGYDSTVGHIRIQELADLGIVAAGIPQGQEAAFADALRSGYDLEMPGIGHSALAGNGIRAAMLQPGHLWLLTPGNTETAPRKAREILGAFAWFTDLSDGWLALRLSNAGRDGAVRQALARICMLDLETFADGGVSRTLMEHLAVVILREGESFTIFSARSSARSLLRAVEISARHAAPPVEA